MTKERVKNLARSRLMCVDNNKVVFSYFLNNRLRVKLSRLEEALEMELREIF